MPLVAAKDPLAFEFFYDRHGGAAFSLAYRIVGSRQAAEDVTQEALISIWRSGTRFDRRAAASAHGRWDRPQPRHRPAAPRCRTGAEARNSTRGVAGEAPPRIDRCRGARRETAREVRGALDLPTSNPGVISLAFFGGFSHSEIVHAERAVGTSKRPHAPGHGEDLRLPVPGSTNEPATEPGGPRGLRHRRGSMQEERVVAKHLDRCWEECATELAEKYGPSVAVLAGRDRAAAGASPEPDGHRAPRGREGRARRAPAPLTLAGISCLARDGLAVIVSSGPGSGVTWWPRATRPRPRPSSLEHRVGCDRHARRR